MAAILQIVGYVGSTTPLLDLNDNPGGILIQRGSGSGGLALADVQSADVSMPVWTGPGSGSFPEATNRQITVPVHLLASTPDLVGAKVTSLARLLGQPWVLRVRRSGASVDGWVRCYPTIPQVATTITGPDQARGSAAGVITAATEPYAYGARVDVGSVTVPLANRTTASAFLYDVSGVGGDAPTPIVIRTSDTGLIGAPQGTLIAIRRTGTPTSLTGWVTAATAGTAAVAGTGVTTSVLSGDGGMSGGAGVRWTFAAGYTTGGGANYGRLTYTPALTGAEAPGLYKIVARVRRSTSEELTIYPTVAGTYALDGLVFPSGGSNTRVLDLGTVQLPAGQAQQLAAPTPAPIGAEAPTIRLDIWKTVSTGASTFDIDYCALVPCDEDAGVVYQSAAAPGSGWLSIDGYAQDAYMTTGDPFVGASTGSSAAVRLDYIGGVPRLYPGVTNRLILMSGFSAAASASNALAAAAAVNVSYWPRYVWLP